MLIFLDGESFPTSSRTTKYNWEASSYSPIPRSISRHRHNRGNPTSQAERTLRILVIRVRGMKA